VLIIGSALSLEKAKGVPWQRLEGALKAAGVNYEMAITKCAGDAIRLGREAASSSHDRVVAVGGDGTLGEIINGLLEAGEVRKAIGLLPLGRGNDFARCVPVPLSAEQAVNNLLRAEPKPIDVIRFECADNKTPRRHFVNLCSIGFPANVAEAVESYGRNVGGTWPYVRGLVSCLRRWENFEGSIELNGEQIDTHLFTVNVTNGRFYGGGMYASPKARIDDGLLDVTIMEGLSTLEIFRYMPNNYSGRFDSIGKIRMLVGNKVRVTTPRPALVQVDGDVVGVTPASFEIVPRAVPFLY
jgi:YegS/Rv2252/BmrU family lipid kinase